MPSWKWLSFCIMIILHIDTATPTFSPTVPTESPTFSPNTYNGLVSNEYFQSEFTPSTINTVKNINCDFSGSETMDIGTTTLSQPIIYYKFGITTNMISYFKSVLQITTFCNNNTFNLLYPRLYPRYCG
eukprot:301283_1